MLCISAPPPSTWEQLARGEGESRNSDIDRAEADRAVAQRRQSRRRLVRLLLNLNPVDLMGTVAVVIETGLRNGDGSSRADVIRRHCSIGREVFVRRTSEQLGPHSMAVFLRVPRFFGLLGSRLAQIGYLDTRAEAMMTKVEPAEKDVRAVVKSVYAPLEKDNPRVTIIID